MRINLHNSSECRFALIRVDNPQQQAIDGKNTV